MNIQCNSYVFVSIINVINFHTAIDNVFNNKQRVYFSSPTLPWPAAKRKIVNWGRNCYGCYSSIQSAPNVTPLCQTTDTPNIDQSLRNLVKFLFKVVSFNKTKKN